MYLLDTNVISEVRKGSKANVHVLAFLACAKRADQVLYLSSITIGELVRGVELLRHRGDVLQANQISQWLNTTVDEFKQFTLSFSCADAVIWGKLRVPHPENALDKQIAAIAYSHGLTLVTRNIKDFEGCGVALLNPFEPM